jgi:peptide deformylase
MPLRRIVVVPHNVLSKPAEPVKNIDDAIRKLAKDMAETMYRAPGIGLAANQVGELIRLIVLDVQYPYAPPREKKRQPIFLVNPEITALDGKTVKEEGCLSVPEFGIEITRAERIEVHAFDLEGKAIKIEADGLLARALQHEIDHLNGKTILDHASTLKRTLYQRRMRKKPGKDT